MNNYICALSGQSPIEDPVCTPTGQICSKRLLLTKLTETNGSNPFLSSTSGGESSSNLLDESQLIDLKPGINSSNTQPPKLPSSNSIPTLLTSLQSEYDTLVLELYDTRRALEETRRELSEALYQNDAAIRVIARVSLERDVARREVQNMATAAASLSDTDATATSNKRRRVDEQNNADVVPDDIDEQMQDSNNDGDGDSPVGTTPSEIPPIHTKALEAKWKQLSSLRKKALKKSKKSKKDKDDSAADDNYATLEMLSGWECTQKKNLHKSNYKPGLFALKGIASSTSCVDITVTCARDKQLIIYSAGEEKIALKQSIKTIVASSGCLDCHTDTTEDGSGEGLVACVGEDNNLRLFQRPDTESKWKSLSNVPVLGDDGDGEKVIGVCIHPTGKHVITVTSTGNIVFFALETEDDDINVKKIATFKSKDPLPEGVECTALALHPDGLILGVGRSDGKVSIWDLKTQKLASTLEEPNNSKISVLAFSESGYHVATSSANCTISLWDLRKQKLVSTLSINSDDSDADGDTINSVSFCPTGKFIAYGTSSGKIALHVVKDGEKKVILNTDSAGSVCGLLWGANAQSLISCSDGDRSLKTWGMAVKDP